MMRPIGAPPFVGVRRTARRDGGVWWRTGDADRPGGAGDGGGTEVVVPTPGSGRAPRAAVGPVAPVPATDGAGPDGFTDDGDAPDPPWPPDAPVAVAVVVGGEVEGAVLDGVVVVVVGGTDAGHSVWAPEGERGGGSAGVALPSGSKRHPSTSPADTVHDAGPSLA